jgi:hypothetical protein
MNSTTKNIVLLLITGSLWTIQSEALWACSCACIQPIPNTPNQHLKEATTVFIGKVTKNTETSHQGTMENESEHDITFQVAKIWKGTPYKTLVVHTRNGCCGSLDFKMGQEYLVYAHGTENKLYDSSCSVSKELNDAKEDLQKLGSAKLPSIDSPNQSTNSPLLIFLGTGLLGGIVSSLILRNRRSKLY